MSLDASDLPPVPPRQNLREQVVYALRAALAAGEMRPGVVYSAPMLAEQFGVSPTPVREAMLDLAKEGLVEAVRNKGFRVIVLTERDLDEIGEVRALIEIPAVRSLAGRVPEEAAGRLRDLAARGEAAAVRGDALACAEAGRRFHLELLTLYGNTHLVEVARGLRDRAAGPGRLAASAREHTELLDHLVAGRAADAEDLLRRHLRG